jgi:hypothetical protein
MFIIDWQEVVPHPKRPPKANMLMISQSLIAPLVHLLRRYFKRANSAHKQAPPSANPDVIRSINNIPALPSKVIAPLVPTAQSRAIIGVQKYRVHLIGPLPKLQDPADLRNHDDTRVRK